VTLYGSSFFFEDFAFAKQPVNLVFVVINIQSWSPPGLSGALRHGMAVRRIRLFHHERKSHRGFRVWVNSEDLHVGNETMRVLVAGVFKTKVLSVFEPLLSVIKNRTVTEQGLA
jgi:hypothetical protein